MEASPSLFGAVSRPGTTTSSLDSVYEPCDSEEVSANPWSIGQTLHRHEKSGRVSWKIPLARKINRYEQ